MKKAFALGLIMMSGCTNVGYEGDYFLAKCICENQDSKVKSVYADFGTQNIVCVDDSRISVPSGYKCDNGIEE